MVVAFVVGVFVGVGGFWLWLEWPLMTQERRDRWYSQHAKESMEALNREWERMGEEERRLCKMQGWRWDFWGARWER